MAFLRMELYICKIRVFNFTANLTIFEDWKKTTITISNSNYFKNIKGCLSSSETDVLSLSLMIMAFIRNVFLKKNISIDPGWRKREWSVPNGGFDCRDLRESFDIIQVLLKQGTQTIDILHKWIVRKWTNLYIFLYHFYSDTQV